MRSQISVIVPVYNISERFLRRCLESICRQTLKEIEIIIVDDGSTDNSGKICDDFQNEDSRIIVIHKPNEGLSAARNTGFNNAHSKWLMFVDGDDWIEPHMCEDMLLQGEENDVDIVMCSFSKDYKNSSSSYPIKLEDRRIYRGDECKRLQELLLHYNYNIATAYCKLIRYSCLKDNEILHNTALRQGAEGLEFNIRLFERIRSAIFLSKPYYHYVYNNASISTTHNEENHLYVVKCFEAIKTEIISSSNKEALLHWLNNRLLYVIVTTAISGYFSPANKEPYALKKKKFKNYLQIKIINDALWSGDYQELSLSRKFILFLIKHKIFSCVCILAYLRKVEKNNK